MSIFDSLQIEASRFLLGIGELLASTFSDDLGVSLTWLSWIKNQTFLSTFNEICHINDIWPNRVWFSAFLAVLVPYTFLRIIIATCSWSARQRSDTQWSGDTVENIHRRRCNMEAARWFRQAEYDLTAARRDAAEDGHAFEWACFKCRQAVEKTVRSVLLMQTQRTVALSDTSDLHALATATQDHDIIRTSLHVLTVTGSNERMLRPDSLSFPKVPRDVYSQRNADTMLELTESLLDYTRNLYLTKL